MSTHTPGPWVIHKHGPESPYLGNVVREWQQDGMTHMRTITIQLKYDTPEVNEANAQLIAAAPDMLKALEGCLRVAKAHYLDMVDQYTDDDPDIEEHLRHAHPNIAAAAMEVKRLETIIYKATGDV